MKFFITKDLTQSGLLKSLMIGVSLALVLYLLIDIVLHVYILGDDYGGVVTTLYGNVEEFVDPMLIDAILTQVHVDLFMSLFMVMMLGSMYIRLYSESKTTIWLVHILFISSLVTPIFLMVAYLTSVPFLYLWFFTFVVEHALGIFMALAIVKKLVIK